jgi:hypothetical protein
VTAGAQTPPSLDPKQPIPRPENTPDFVGWDETTGTYKWDDLKDVPDLRAFKAAQDSKALTRPDAPEKYEAKLPSDFTLPEGVAFEIDAKDPIFAEAQKFAHAAGLSQDEFSNLLKINVEMRVAERKSFDELRAGEMRKLGEKSADRLKAVETFLKAIVGDDLAAPIMATTVTEKQVHAFEKLMGKFSSQGAGSFSQAGREPPDNNKIPGYETMTFEQRRAAQWNRQTRANMAGGGR